MSQSARRYDLLQAEASADERADIRARGGIAPNHDGSPRTVVAGRLVGGINIYRARCSCSFEGTDYTSEDYRAALDERNAHRCANTQEALSILRQNGLL